MCVIAFTDDSRHLPTRAQLECACDANPDGFGWAVVSRRRIVTGHTMDAQEAIDGYLDAAGNASGPSLFHARIASHGTVDLSNCHPFLVGGDDKIVLAHNGILPITPGPFDTRSDTAIFADEYLPHAGIETLDAGQQVWEDWIGHGNKIVVLSVSPTLRRSSYVLNADAGLVDAGVWWSNSSYRPYRSLYGRYAPAWATEPVEDGEDEDDEIGVRDECCSICRELWPSHQMTRRAGERWCPECAASLAELTG